MRTKLTLNLEDLSVDSFDTSATQKEEGTVFGEQQCTCGATCTCPGCPSCYETCQETCYDTCAPTCAISCGAYCPPPTKDETCPFTCDVTGCSVCMG